MHVAQPHKIVVLGMMTQKVVAGHVWAVFHYLEGLRRLGYDVYYVEAHSRTPSAFFRTRKDDGWADAAGFVAKLMRRLDLQDRWAYHDIVHGRCFGLSAESLKSLYDSAALILNMHGATVPLPEHSATGKLVYIDTDPGKPQVDLQQNEQWFIDALSAHCALFTYAENYGHDDCRLPVSERFEWKPMRAPVVMDFWEPYRRPPGRVFTTIGSWSQPKRVFEVDGDTYNWSKHYEFLKVIDLPRRTPQEFELALAKCEPEDFRLLESHGWKQRRAADISADLDAYRDYITTSRGEFTVSKDQYVRLRTGWFSNRSNTYLAAGLPVITQETGFSKFLPSGAGLFGFSSMDEILAAVDDVNADYERHCRAALDIARDYFNYDVVLEPMLAEVGL